MNYDGKVVIGTEIDSKSAERDLDKIKKSTQGIGKETDKVTEKQEKYKKTTEETTKSVGGLGKAIAAAFVVKVLIDFGKEAIKLASDLDEVQNVVDTAFGSMADQANKFAETSIESFGLSELTAKKTASTFMSMAAGMDLTGQKATDMALNLTGLTGDMASFYNVSQDVAETALASIFTGETESLKKFGIVMTETNLQQFAYKEGMNKLVSEMTEAEKVQLRYNFVLDKTKLAQGDFVKTSDSWANQTRVLKEQFKEFMAEIGEDLIAILTPLLALFVSLLNIFEALLTPVIDLLAKGFAPLGTFFEENALAVDNFTIALVALFTGIYTALKIQKIPEMIKDFKDSLKILKKAFSEITIEMAATAAVIAILVAAIILVVKNWGKMNDFEKIASVFGIVTLAAVALAVAIGAVQSAMSYGIAAAAIVAGVAAIGISITAATKRAKQDAQSSVGTIPRYANGGVFYGGDPMLGILNDQPRGQVNVETPLQTMLDAFNTSLDSRNGGMATNIQPTINIRFNGELSQLARILKPEIDMETNRIGTRLVEGRA